MSNRDAYRARYLNRSGHFQTVFPVLFRRIGPVNWQRERISTPDNDFIDLDWLAEANSRLLLLCHGLEGSSEAHYMKGMARACGSAGWDVVAYNFRGCSGEANRIARSYHSGSTDDLALVICHALKNKRYKQLALTGFSLGGNLVLKYLGEPRHNRPDQLCGGSAISPPCDLSACSDRLARPANRIYQVRFLRSLRAKVRVKAALIEAQLGPISNIPSRTIREFDQHFVAPLNGFASAEDYYQRASALQFLSTVDRPALLLSALDDPFLPQSCFPSEKAINNPMINFRYTRYGGHVSFMQSHPEGWYWGEQENVAFLESISNR